VTAPVDALNERTLPVYALDKRPEMVTPPPEGDMRILEVEEMIKLLDVLLMLPVGTRVTVPLVGAETAGGVAFGEYGFVDERFACIPHFHARYPSTC